ncbi:MAG TPA: prepilin peptidase [Bdellovibrionota bacterium]|jgi:leader peptidase (prepilin peptidase)/N-methyltransferase
MFEPLDLPPFAWRILLFFIFLFGLCWGSFLNVVIHRLPKGESVVKPRSRCPKCKKLIPWHWNVPVLSWIVLGGKCANCKKKIAWRYPLVELLTACLFTLSAVFFPVLIAWPFHFFFLAALVACTFIDIDHWILPDKITLPGIVVGLASSLLIPGFHPLDSFAGVVVGGGILYLVAWAYKMAAKRDGLGGGDIKFLAMVGAFLGVRGALTSLVLSSFLGSILGIFLIALKGKKGSTAVQFGPFLALGALAAFFFGEPLWQWYFGNR